MKRFYRGKTGHTRKQLLSVLLFLLIAGTFYCGITEVSAQTDRRQRVSLEEALQRGIAHCYAVEGRYPESLAYLQKEYGISYDPDQYFVDYQVLGSNIMPDVTIIEK